MKKHKGYHWSIEFKFYIFYHRLRYFHFNFGQGCLDMSIGPLSLHFRVESNWVQRTRWLPWLEVEYYAPDGWSWSYNIAERWWR